MSDFLQAAAGNYKAGRSLLINYIVIHYTANNGDTAAGNAKYFHNNKNLKASAHYFVDEKEVWQAVREGDTAYHCGGGLQGTGGHAFYGLCSNGNSIGIELCSRKDARGRYYFKEETLENAAELARGLMKKYGIPAGRVIRHYDVTGKICPAPLVDRGKWLQFKARLEDKEVEKQQKIKLNGKEKTVHVIEKNGYNYVKLQDLRDERIEISYDGVPVVRVIK
ncbi:MAG: N-acetylmuramoyl-L-alanine amidase family protein [Bacillota bacterium]|jgi:N-acetylmuramoyl-L-alanine amidase CwlA